MSRVIVVGSVNVDQIIRCPTLPAAGETVLARRRTEGFGGKGGNQAAAAARMGAETWLIAAVGEDAAGSRAVADLERFGVRTDHVHRRAGADTGEALVAVDDLGENLIIVVPGANALLTGADVTAALADLALDPSDVVLTNGEVSEECGRAAARSCAAVGARLIYNLAPARSLGSWPRLARTTLVLNEVELVRVAGGGPAAEAALAAQVDSVLITRGSRGARLLDGDGAADIAAPAVDLVDSTGAGDAFCGGLAAELAGGRYLRAAATAATYAGSFAVTAIGARGALPTREALLGPAERRS